MSSLPSNRRELRDWALRKLGAPVLQVNLEEQQVEDLITEAITTFQEFHYDGVESLWIKHQITASELFYTAPMGVTLEKGVEIVGLTSGAKAKHFDQRSDNLSSRHFDTVGTFQNGEIVEVRGGEHAGVQFEIKSSNGVFVGDIDNEYIPVSDQVLYITKALPISRISANALVFGSVYNLGNGPNSIDLKTIWNHMGYMNGFDLVTYDMFKRHMALIEFEFNAMKGVSFNRVTDKVKIDITWDENLVDKWIIFEAHTTLSPKDYPQIYRDKWLRWYLVALLKYQWAWNLLKYEGQTLPGGVTVNASDMLSEAKEEKEKLEKELESKYQLPTLFEVG